MSLYYYIRYNIALSDAFANDGISFNNSVSAVLQTDLVVRVTTHPFNENGDAKTRQFDRNKLKELAEQEGSDPDYLSLGRKQIGISDLVRYHYEDGLNEIRSGIKDEILNWRREVFNYISKTKKGN